MDAQKVTATLLRFSNEFDPAELFPSVDDEASRFAIENRFAFALACCLDRGTKSSLIWSIPRDLNRAIGHLDPARLAAMSVEELDHVYRALPRKPRYINDAPRTTRELAQLVTRRFAGDASKMWTDRSAAEVNATFRSIHGVGPGLASMTVLLLVRAYGVEFHERDRPGIDIKADVHTSRVLWRLGASLAQTESETVDAARRLNPTFPGAIDGSLWIIGTRWCRPTGPRCGECVVAGNCEHAGPSNRGNNRESTSTLNGAARSSQ